MYLHLSTTHPPTPSTHTHTHIHTQFYSAYTHDTLFETDERLRYLGFDIDDLGCCKCVYHPIWGAFAFVGIIFTDAPASSPILRSIMEL